MKFYRTAATTLLDRSVKIFVICPVREGVTMNEALSALNGWLGNRLSRPIGCLFDEKSIPESEPTKQATLDSEYEIWETP